MNKYEMVPVGWQYCQYGKWWNGDNLTKDQRKNIEEAGLPVRDVYAAPQPAEQQPLKSSLALEAATHLTNWLDADLCECEGGHSCGYYEVERTRDALLAAAEQQPDVTRLVEALESLMKGYASLLEGGWDRITHLNGDCDLIPDMLRDAQEALAAYHRKQGGES